MLKNADQYHARIRCCKVEPSFAPLTRHKTDTGMELWLEFRPPHLRPSPSVSRWVHAQVMLPNAAQYHARIRCCKVESSFAPLTRHKADTGRSEERRVEKEHKSL